MTSWQGLGVAHAAPPQGFISPIYCLIYECCYGPTLLPSLRPTVPSFCSLPQQQRSNNTVSTKTCFCTKKIQTFLMIFIDKELQEEREWGGDTHTHTPSHTLSAVSQTHPHTHTPTHTETHTLSTFCFTSIKNRHFGGTSEGRSYFYRHGDSWLKGDIFTSLSRKTRAVVKRQRLHSSNCV